MHNKFLKLLNLFIIFFIFISCNKNIDSMFLLRNGEKSLKKSIKLEIKSLDSLYLRFGAESTTPSNLLKFYDYKTIINNSLLESRTEDILKITNYKNLKVNNNEFTHNDYVVRCDFKDKFNKVYSFAINIDNKLIWINGNHYIINDNTDFINLIPITLPGYYRINN